MMTLNSIEQINKLHEEGKLVGLFQISNKLYHECIGLSKSSLPHLLKSTGHYAKYARDGITQTPNMKLGSLVHLLILEPHLFDETYAVSQKFDRRTTVGKKGFADFEATKGNREVIDEEMLATAKLMVKAIMAKVNARKLLQGIYELAAFWICPETKILCKAKFDVIGRTSRLLVDIKTAQDAEADAFMKQAFNLTYGLQSAWYTDGISMAIQQSGEVPNFKIPDKFIFLAVESAEPFGVALYELPAEYIDNSREQCKKALLIYKEYMETKIETVYSDEIKVLQPRSYQYK